MRSFLRPDGSKRSCLPDAFWLVFEAGENAFWANLPGQLNDSE